ncbi:MAG: hypothetical protein WA097_07045 [Candidatus Hydromicrobium sp.]
MERISWGEVEKSLLKNYEVAKECEKLEPEFQKLRRLIILRKGKKIIKQELPKLTDMK